METGSFPTILYQTEQRLVLRCLGGSIRVTLMGRGGPNPNREVMMKTTFSVEAIARYFLAIIFKENEIFE